MADDEMSRAEAASWLVRIANDLRSAGDMPLIRMNTNGVGPASMSLADELWLVAFCLDIDTATNPLNEARRG